MAPIRQIRRTQDPPHARRNKMKILGLILVLFLPSSALAQQVPWGRPDIPISEHDRVYAANQTSNTVSVIDPSTNKLLGLIRLGDPVPASLSPLYQVNCWCM